MIEAVYRSHVANYFDGENVATDWSGQVMQQATYFVQRPAITSSCMR